MGDLRNFHEPYRLFFPLGLLMGLLGVGHWLLYGLGVTAEFSGGEHASIQIQSFLICFVVGFLMTAIPKMMLARPATAVEFLYFLVLVLAIPWLQTMGQWAAVHLDFALILAGLFFYMERRCGARQAPMPAEFHQLPYSFGMGILGALLISAHHLFGISADFALVGRQMIQLGFMLAIVMGVGGFMGPRMMGLYSAMIAPIELDPEKKRTRHLRNVRFQHLCGALLFLSFWLDPWVSPEVGAAVRALVVSVQILRTARVYLFPPEKNITIGLLWISYWCLMTGLWGAFLFPAYRIAALHFVFIGGFSLMTFAVATKVIFAHAGLEEAFHRPLIPMWILGLLVFAALGLRVLADFLPSLYFPLLTAAAASWILGALVWLSFVGMALLRPARVPGGCATRRCAYASKI